VTDATGASGPVRPDAAALLAHAMGHLLQLQRGGASPVILAPEAAAAGRRCLAADRTATTGFTTETWVSTDADQARPGALDAAERLAVDAALAGGRPVLDGRVLAVPCLAGERRLGAMVASISKRAEVSTGEAVAVLLALGTVVGVATGTRSAAADVENQALRAEAHRAAELERAKSNLLNLAAHELRGPVAVARGYASMLADSSFDKADLQATRRAAAVVFAKLGEVNNLIDQMLESARLDDRRLELALRRFDVRGTIRQVAATLAPLAHRHAIRINRLDEPLMVDADPDRVATILTNLLDNACKYSPGREEVEVHTGRRGDMVEVVVTDHGFGIADADLPRVFERFSRIVTAENSHIQGTGLGLHLCRELARMHGGDITVRSRLGEGSTFTLTLPAAPAPQSVSEASSARKRSGGT
jgi:signal transduction histidine kinase